MQLNALRDLHTLTALTYLFNVICFAFNLFMTLSWKDLAIALDIINKKSCIKQSSDVNKINGVSYLFLFYYA